MRAPSAPSALKRETVLKATTVAIVSDLHVGSTVGLINGSGAILDDGGTYVPSHAQRWLWQSWQDYISKVKKASKGGARVYIVVNGDAVDGKPHGSVQVITDNFETQVKMATDCILPLSNIADRLFVIRGTAAHTGPVSQYEEWLAKELGAEESFGGTRSWWELEAEFGGVLFNISHHPPGGGGRLWTVGGPAVRLAAETVQYYGGRGLRVPALAFRGHIHKRHDSNDNVRGCRGIIMRAWQLRTEYGWRIAGQPADIGGYIVQTENGKYNLEEVAYEPEQRPAWQEKKK